MLQGLSRWQKVAVAVTVPASIGLLYLLLRDGEEDYDHYERSPKNFVIKEEISVEIVVPRDKVGAVIGKGGCVINKVREETGAKLNFQDHEKESDAPRVLKITGKPSSAMEAEQRIQQLLSAPAPKTVEMLIPTKTVGRIVGKGGANIRSICRGSGARVRIARAEETPTDQNSRVCTIRGTPEDIARAKAMIEEEIAIEEEKSQRLTNAAGSRMRRSPEKKGGGPLSLPQLEQVRFPSHGDYFTVFVSAVEHPSHFWMQIVSGKGPELDLMVEDMTEFYSQVRNKESYLPESLCTGDIVAAPFEHDSAWYRAKIVGFLDDNQVDMYFVDYGDYESVAKDSLFKLRSDFLSLPFQAIECSLAGVEPFDMNWKEEAIDAFDDLTHCAQWQPLMARMMGYKSLEKKTLPCVDLIDTLSEEDINVAAELIKQGFARDTTVSSARKATGDNKMKPEDDARPIQRETAEKQQDDHFEG